MTRSGYSNRSQSDSEGSCCIFMHRLSDGLCVFIPSEHSRCLYLYDYDADNSTSLAGFIRYVLQGSSRSPGLTCVWASGHVLCPSLQLGHWPAWATTSVFQGTWAKTCAHFEDSVRDCIPVVQRWACYTVRFSECQLLFLRGGGQHGPGLSCELWSQTEGQVFNSLCLSPSFRKWEKPLYLTNRLARRVTWLDTLHGDKLRRVDAPGRRLMNGDSLCFVL